MDTQELLVEEYRIALERTANYNSTVQSVRGWLAAATGIFGAFANAGILPSLAFCLFILSAWWSEAKNRAGQVRLHNRIIEIQRGIQNGDGKPFQLVDQEAKNPLEMWRRFFRGETMMFYGALIILVVSLADFNVT